MPSACSDNKDPHSDENIPVKDMITNKHYITPQNHGFGVDNYTMPSDWKPLSVDRFFCIEISGAFPRRNVGELWLI